MTSYFRTTNFADDRDNKRPFSADTFDREFNHVFAALNDLNAYIGRLDRSGFFSLADAPVPTNGVLAYANGSLQFTDPSYVKRAENGYHSLYSGSHAIDFRESEIALQVNHMPRLVAGMGGVDIFGSLIVKDDASVGGAFYAAGLHLKLEGHRTIIDSIGGFPVEFSGGNVGIGTTPSAPLHVRGLAIFENGIGSHQPLITLKGSSAREITMFLDGIEDRGLTFVSNDTPILAVNEQGIEVGNPAANMRLTPNSIELSKRSSLSVRTNDQTRLHVDMSGDVSIAAAPLGAKFGILARKGADALRVLAPSRKPVMAVTDTGTVRLTKRGIAECFVPHPDLVAPVEPGRVFGITLRGEITDRYSLAQFFVVAASDPAIVLNALDDGHPCVVMGSTEVHLDSEPSSAFLYVGTDENDSILVTTDSDGDRLQTLGHLTKVDKTYYVLLK